MAEDSIFLCGYKPKRRMKYEDLTKAELKTVSNYQDFLRGKGSRCTLCLHKAAKHGLGVGDCHARDCDCQLSVAQVIVLRAKAKAPGWEKDEA